MIAVVSRCSLSLARLSFFNLAISLFVYSSNEFSLACSFLLEMYKK